MNIKNGPLLEEYEKYLKEKGYKLFPGHYKKEDRGWWKGFDYVEDEYGDKTPGYQIALLLYDWSKYPIITKEADCFMSTGIQFEALITNILGYNRLDVIGDSDDITLEKWEKKINEMVNFMNI